MSAMVKGRETHLESDFVNFLDFHFSKNQSKNSICKVQKYDIGVWCSVGKKLRECRMSQLLAKSKCMSIFRPTTYATDAFLSVATL